MAFTVETGLGVADANALASVAYVRAYADSRGLAVPVADTDLQRAIVVATDYVKTFRYIGAKTYAGQRYLPWPRTGLTIDDEAVPANEIPADILAAVAQLVVEQTAGIDISPTRLSGSAIKREVTGPLETEYVVGSSGAGRPDMPRVNALLDPFIDVSAARSGIMTVARG